MEIISKARAASDTRHRIPYPNSHRRVIQLVGLGAGGARIVRDIGALDWNHVQVLIPDAAMDAGALQKLNMSDMIFMVACAGDDLELAPLIKQAGRARGVPLTGILIQQAGGQQAPAAALRILRAASDMLVIASDDSYVTDMLEQLGA